MITVEKSRFGTFTGSAGVLYACPANAEAKVSVLSGEEVSGTSVLITIQVYVQSEDDTFVIFKGRSLPVVFYEHPIILQPGDRIEVSAAGTSPEIDAMVTVQEIYKPRNAMG